MFDFTKTLIGLSRIGKIKHVNDTPHHKLDKLLTNAKIQWHGINHSSPIGLICLTQLAFYTTTVNKRCMPTSLLMPFGKI